MKKEDLEIYQEINEDEIIQLKDASQGESYTQPFSLGYEKLDKSMKGGMRMGDLCVITGISEHGKSTLAHSIILNLTLRDYACLCFSYEVSLTNFYAKIKETGLNIEDLKIFVPKKNTSGNIDWIKQKIIEGKEKFNTDFIFIDDVDFLSPKKRIFDSGTYRHIVGAITRELKFLATELDVAIFLIAHVKKIEKGKGVEMQDLAESGDLYKKPDFVIAITRNTIEKKVGGVKVQTYTEHSTLRLLKNRLTGEHPIIDLELVKQRLQPIGEQPKDIIDKEINVENIFENND